MMANIHSIKVSFSIVTLLCIIVLIQNETHPIHIVVLMRGHMGVLSIYYSRLSMKFNLAVKANWKVLYEGVCFPNQFDIT